MVWIAALLSGLVLFYFWLQGHWFARWVVAIALFVPTFLVAIEINGGAKEQQTLSVVIFALVVSIGGGWIIASLPTFYWRAKWRANTRLVDRLLNPPISHQSASAGSSIAFRKGA